MRDKHTQPCKVEFRAADWLSQCLFLAFLRCQGRQGKQTACLVLSVQNPGGGPAGGVLERKRPKNPQSASERLVSSPSFFGYCNSAILFYLFAIYFSSAYYILHITYYIYLPLHRVHSWSISQAISDSSARGDSAATFLPPTPNPNPPRLPLRRASAHSRISISSVISFPNQP